MSERYGWIEIDGKDVFVERHACMGNCLTGDCSRCDLFRVLAGRTE